MKRIVGAVLLVVFVGGQAFASKARLESLGQSASGSWYINDNRNIFSNPAYVTRHSELMTLEWGNTANASDTPATPKAEGGLFKKNGGLVLGLHLGAEQNSDALMRSKTDTTWDDNEDTGAASATDPVVVPQGNFTDFFVGGKTSSMRWGAGLSYGTSSNENAMQKYKESNMAVSFGAIMKKMEFFANLSLQGEAKVSNKDAGTAAGTTEKDYKGKTGMAVGGTMDLGMMSGHVKYENISVEEKKANRKADLTVIQLGAAKPYHVKDKAKVWTSVHYVMKSLSVDPVDSAGATKIDIDSTYMPIAMSLEAPALDWLVLRGSVTQNVLISDSKRKTTSAGSSAETKNSLPTSTVVAAGASLVYDDLSIDGSIGNDAGTGPGENTATGNGTLRSDSLLSRVSMTYNF